MDLRKGALWLGLACLVGCGEDPLTDFVRIAFVAQAPLEVDCIPNDTNGDGQVSGYHAEEVSVAIRFDTTESAPAETLPDVLLSEYGVSYVLQSGTEEMPFYNNGTTIFLAPGESGEFPLRAVSFEQKEWCGREFGGDPVNGTATLTLQGHEANNENRTFEVRADFDIIFADFEES